MKRVLHRLWISPPPTPPCFGFGDKDLHNPGGQHDFLYRVLQGKYYGHPNPSRSECVFKDGTLQGVPPLANWLPPLYDLGNHKSPDGMIEYTSNAFCGALQGELLIANYSQGDNISRTRFSADGTAVLSSTVLVGGFNDPLPLAMGQNGVIYVGESGSNKVTALTPVSSVCTP